jgi:hypothetical protein
MIFRNARFTKLLLLIFLLLLLVNVAFFCERNSMVFKYSRASDYNDIYFQQESPRISSISPVAGGKINIHILPSRPEPIVIIANNTDTSTSSSSEVVINSNYGINTFKIFSKTKRNDTVEISINKLHKEAYIGYDENTPDDILIVNSTTIPILTNNFLPVDIWKSNYDYVSPSELIAAKKILTEEASVSATDNDITKLKKISKFILDKLDDKRGIPSSFMISSTPFQQYQNAIENKSKVWCGNFTHIYAFFANVAGLTTRQVDVNSNMGSVITSAHAFNESYIKEQNLWAFVDLNSSEILVYNKSQKPLNALDLFQLRKMKVYDGINACVYSKSQLLELPYKDVNQSELKFFKREAFFTYNFPESYALNYSGNGQLFKKIKNYVIPSEASLYYSENAEKKNFFLFYARFFFLYLFLFFAAVIFLAFTNYMIKAKQNNQQSSMAAPNENLKALEENVYPG